MCRQALQGGAPQFATSWPSVIWTFISKQKREPEIVGKVLRIITPIMFVHWLPSSMEMSITAKTWFTENQMISTLDRTIDFNKWRNMQDNPSEEMKEGKWEKMLNDHPFEDVRCPAGCHRFIDDEGINSAEHWKQCKCKRTARQSDNIIIY